jgi:hypothetical protein
VPGYEWFNAVQEEMIHVLLRAGVSPAQGDLSQLRQAMDRLYGGGLVTYLANATLTIADAGVVEVNASAGPRVITLPAASAMNGRPIPIRVVKTDNSANTVTVQRAGADLIEGVASLVLTSQFSSAALISNGVTTWYNAAPFLASTTQRGIARFATTAETDVGAVADAVITPAGLAGAMGKLLAANGYQRLPGGLILQWGQTTTGNMTTSPLALTATFPLAFPGAVLNVVGSVFSLAAAGSAVDAYVTDIRTTLTGITAYLEERVGSVTQNCGCRYLAIGY